MFKTYYHLTKPGIIYGNALTTIAGFFFGSKLIVNPLLLLETLIGSSLIVASACVFNNYIDRKIDKKMARTKNRSLVIGSISVRNALIFGTVLGVLGFTILSVYTNWLTVLVGLVGFLDYVVFYGLGKRKTVHGTLIGTIAGSTPILAGYTAVTGRIDIAATLLFLLMAFWQMAHFYAISIYRLSDYEKAQIPVLPAKNGIATTKVQIVIYIIAFALANGSLTYFGYTGVTYLIVTGALSLFWLGFAVKNFNKGNDTYWARKVFLNSLIVVTGLSAALIFSAFLP